MTDHEKNTCLNELTELGWHLFQNINRSGRDNVDLNVHRSVYEWRGDGDPVMPETIKPFLY